MDVNIDIKMKNSKLKLALVITLACALGMLFGYKMGVKMKKGDHRVLYPIDERPVEPVLSIKTPEEE